MWRRLLIVTGIAALVAWYLRRRQEPEHGFAPAPDPAEELRRKLDEVREQQADAAAAAEDVDARRREVHERGRAAADDMRQSSPPPE
jgi:hypothetical protein